MYIKCLIRSFRLGYKRLRVGESVEVTPEELASIKGLIEKGIVSVHQHDPNGKRKERSSRKSATKAPAPKPKAVAPKRARTDLGHYVADDPKTESVNEAWVGGKAPVVLEKMKKTDLVAMAKDMGIDLPKSITKSDIISKIKEGKGE